jgi:hypothetical protein
MALVELGVQVGRGKKSRYGVRSMEDSKGVKDGSLSVRAAISNRNVNNN